MTNFLFCDGHVKAMKSKATITPLNMWNVTNTDAATTGNNYLSGQLTYQDTLLK
jgi:prepilin-type processing-associated H-X9-DG protein